MTGQPIGSDVSGIRHRGTIGTVLAAIAVALLGVLIFTAPTLADPPSTLISPPNHRHFLVTPSGGMIPVGPQICGNPELQQAFNEFHYNIHHSVHPLLGPIQTLGPQDGAPGLHNGRGANLVAIPGCG